MKRSASESPWRFIGQREADPSRPISSESASITGIFTATLKTFHYTGQSSLSSITQCDPPGSTSSNEPRENLVEVLAQGVPVVFLLSCGVTARAVSLCEPWAISKRLDCTYRRIHVVERHHDSGACAINQRNRYGERRSDDRYAVRHILEDLRGHRVPVVRHVVEQR